MVTYKLVDAMSLVMPGIMLKSEFARHVAAHQQRVATFSVHIVIAKLMDAKF